MLIIGLTGGIACGKSTVSERLRNHYKFPVIDADKIAKEIVEPGRPAYKQIVDHFGPLIPNLLLPDGYLNRGALGGYVFAHSDELAVLNGITHPKVRSEIISGIVKAYLSLNRVVVLDVPLLFEAGMDKMCGLSMCVVCEADTQLKRLQGRNPQLSLQECRDRINSQMSTEERIEKADIVVDNSSSIEDLYGKLDTAVKGITPSLAKTVLQLVVFPYGMLCAVMCYFRRGR